MSDNLSPAELFAKLSPEEQADWLEKLTPAEKAHLQHSWDFWGRPNQKAPLGDWNTWLILAGRGFGKSRAGAEWIREQAENNPGCRIALVAETAADARDVMILGDSGLIACDPKLTKDSWSPTNRRLSWPNGSTAWCYNATEPDQLRGPQHHCFVAGTQIATPNGLVDVKDISTGDMVLTRSGPHRVYAAKSRKSDVITIKFTNSKVLTGTPDHLILTKNGWKSLITLTTEDELCVMNVSSTAENAGTITDSTTNIAGQGVLNGSTETDYTVQSGKIISERFQKVSTFITKMRTHETIQSKTWKFLNMENIGVSTFLMNQFLNVIGKRKNPLNVSATTADESNLENEKVLTSFVRIVPSEKPTLNAHQEVVYNISVENSPEYFANGILVHNCAWVDELAKFRYMQDTWDQLQFGLRLGEHPQVLVTTTPRPLPLIKRLIADPDTITTRGATLDNQANLAANTVKQLYERYGGTRLGRQELEGEILGDIPGALWNRDTIDTSRIKHDEMPVDFERVYVAVDPAVSNNEGSDEHGIVVVGLARDNDGYAQGYVLEDGTLRGSPEDWATKAISLYRAWSADKIIAEKNQGGDMVLSTLKAVDRSVPVKLVHASRGKVVRAEPISALYEQGRVHHVGRFDQLEDQMCLFSVDNIRSISNGSPDRVDALVWGLTEIFDKITGRRKLTDTEQEQRVLQIKKNKPQFPTGNGAWLAR